MPSSGPDSWLESFREGMEAHRRAPAGAPEPAWRLDRYEIGERIGAGGAADVFRARDRELGREVAVKILHESLGSSATVRERFKREAKVTAGLSHPNLLTIHDAGEAGGRLYLVMELVEGKPLGDLLAERTYDIKAMVRLLEKVSRGVAAAHDRGIVHRDLKPGNILVSRNGEPKVADFGLAHIAGSESGLTQQGTVMGTPLYMAPEQVRGRTSEIGPRTDVYALGAILYEILTGRPPHVGESVTEIYGRIINEDPSAPRRLNARASSELETIALKALEKEPARRYADVAAFGDDLRRYLEGEPILAAPPGVVTLSRKWVRRHRATAVGIVVTGLAVGILSGVFLAGRIVRKRQIASLVESGRRARELHEGLLQDLAGLRSREKELAASDEKQPLWDLQARIDRLQREADARSDEMVAAFSSAYLLDSSDPAPKKELASYHFREFEKAERGGDERAAARAIQSLALYDDGTFRREIDREVPVTIDSRPSGAEVELLRYVEGTDRRLVEHSERKLGRGPVTLSLKSGPWLFILRHDGYREVRLPLYLERGRECRLTVDLYTEAEIGPDFIYVPGGPFISGGDPKVENPTERAIRSTGGYFIARCETTIAEYCAFLNALRREGRRTEMLGRLPRLHNYTAAELEKMPDADAEPPASMHPDEPAAMISWNDAVEYVRWMTRQSKASGRNERFRLPTDEEWEKAARGADGRAFPWGNTFDFTFANVGRKVDDRFVRVRVGACEKDRSPYGVLDMAGGVEECCDGFLDEARGFRSTRGGHMRLLSPDHFRIEWRGGMEAHAPNAGGGLRLVKELPR